MIARPGGRLGLVDWEDSGLRDPALEVADLILHPNQEDLLSWSDWQAFLEPYLAGHANDADFDCRLEGYLAIFPIFWLGLLLRDGMSRMAGGTLADWRVNEMPPNERLRRYLARAQAGPRVDPGGALAALGTVRFF